jgi:hypothetical protein
MHPFIEGPHNQLGEFDPSALIAEDFNRVIEPIREQMVYVADIWKLAMEYAEEILRPIHQPLMKLDDVDEVWRHFTQEDFQAIRSRLMKYADNSSIQDSDSLYELLAVIMHRGSAYSGHYFAYIRDSMHEGKWVLDESAFDHDRTECKTITPLSKKSGETMKSSDVDGIQFFQDTDGVFYVDEAKPLGQLLQIYHSTTQSDPDATNGNEF